MKDKDLKRNLFFTILVVGTLLSLLSIIVNLITGLPLEVNIKWILLIAAGILAMILTKRKPDYANLHFVFFVFLICVFMPYGFINGGGSSSDYVAYSFFMLLIVTYILEGLQQRICVALLIAVFILLHIFEYLYPEVIPVYDVTCRFYDRLIQVPLMLFFSYVMIGYFALSYNESNKKLFHYANYDALTGLLNRWALNDILGKKLSSSYYKGYMLFLDIDSFKLVNDNKGHIVGDDVLRRLGAILLKYFDNEHDLVCRWGGDEFLIIFFGSFECLDSIISKISDEFLSYVNAIEPEVDLSIGFASLEGCKSVEEVFSKSDQLMYKQKNLKKK
jgi:diguanylate cyclase (GGDEF)-like protein